MCGEPLPASLQREGLLMLHELVRLSNQMDDIEPIITLDSRIDYQGCAPRSRVVEDYAQYRAALEEMTKRCDLGWVIAPESDGILHSHVQSLLNAGLPLINCNCDAIRLCSDKLESAQVMIEAGIDMIPTTQLGSDASPLGLPCVIKPRYGVGCEGVRQVVDRDQLQQVVESEDPSQWVQQPYIKGRAASLSIFCWGGRQQVLSFNEQKIALHNGAMRLVQCVTNIAEVTDRMRELAERLVQCISGLKGYIGIDMIEENGKLWVVEINPRLTTSVVGLYAATGINVVDMALRSLLADQLVESETTRNQSVTVHLR